MIIGEIYTGTASKKRYYLQNELYDFLRKKYKKFYFINVNNIFNKKKLKISSLIYKKNIVHFNPKSISELNSFLKSNKIFLINNLSFKFSHTIYHYLVGRNNIFQISFSNIFHFSSYKNENWVHVGFVQKMRYLFEKKISLFVFRSLVILRIIKQIDILCIAQKNIFKKNASTYREKTFFIKKYKHIRAISVKLPFIQKHKGVSKKYITFIDSGIEHADILRRGHLINNEMVKNYFSFLRIYLKKLNKIFHKEIIICLHPSSNYQLYKKELNNFKIFKYKTEKYILNSDLILFHDSTAIFTAIFLHKKIISLKSNIMGDYLNTRRLFYSKPFSFVEHDIEQNLKIKKKLLNPELIKKKNNYNKIVKKNFFTDKDALPIRAVIDSEIQKFIRK